jgi:hypothetical protein
MICSRANVSTRRVFSQYVSKEYYFMDTFLGRVHKVDTKERGRAFSKLDAV